MSRALDRGLSDRLGRLRADGDRRLSAGELAEIIGEVAKTLIAAAVPPDSPARTNLPDNHESGELAADPGAARAALAEIADIESEGGSLSDLRQELDEVRAAMHEAAATFLSVAEAIEGIAGHPDLDPDDQEALYRHATAIYETSGFQDLAGQRLTRAADILRRIELSVVEAQAALGDDGAAQAVAALSDAVDHVETRKMERILHGPQSAGTANTQEEIDKILASFD